MEQPMMSDSIIKARNVIKSNPDTIFLGMIASSIVSDYDYMKSSAASLEGVEWSPVIMEWEERPDSLTWQIGPLKKSKNSVLYYVMSIVAVLRAMKVSNVGCGIVNGNGVGIVFKLISDDGDVESFDILSSCPMPLNIQ